MGGLWWVKGREAITTSQYHSRKKEINWKIKIVCRKTLVKRHWPTTIPKTNRSALQYKCRIWNRKKIYQKAQWLCNYKGKKRWDRVWELAFFKNVVFLLYNKRNKDQRGRKRFKKKLGRSICCNLLKKSTARLKLGPKSSMFHITYVGMCISGKEKPSWWEAQENRKFVCLK